MARGRMISTTIGESRKFAALATDTHRLIYLMVLPHVDRAGRYEADPVLIKGKCLTRLDVDSNTIEAWLKDGVRTGLLHVYEVDGLRILEIVDFERHNKPHHREPESGFPPPDEGTPCYTQESNDAPSMAEAWPKHETSTDEACPPKVRGSKENRRELEVKEKRTHSPEIEKASRPELAASPPRTSHDPGLFMEVWNSNRGRLPAVTTLNAKRKAQIRGLVKEHGSDEALSLFRDATRAVAVDDFWLRRQYGFDNLLAGGKVLSRAEQWRAGSTQLGEGNIALAANVERWAKALPETN